MLETGVTLVWPGARGSHSLAYLKRCWLDTSNWQPTSSDLSGEQEPLQGNNFISLYQCFMLINIITGGKFRFDPFKILLIIIIKVNIILNIHWRFSCACAVATDFYVLSKISSFVSNYSCELVLYGFSISTTGTVNSSQDFLEVLIVNSWGELAGPPKPAYS